MAQHLSTTQMKHRSRLGNLSMVCDARVDADDLPAWTRNEFPDEHLSSIAEKVGLPNGSASDLLKIALFLDCALGMASAGGKGPKAVKRELSVLESVCCDLIKRLSGLSAEAKYELAQVEEVADEDGEVSLTVKEPAIHEAVAMLETVGQWIADAQVPRGQPGNKESPKYWALRRLCQLLVEKKGGAKRSELDSLAEAVVEPIADKYGDESRLRDLVAKVIAESDMMRA